MSAPAAPWVERVRRLAQRAPEWMRSRASVEIHVGGFTQARIEAPLLDVADLEDVDRAARAVIFFVVVAAASDAALARIHLGRRAPWARELSELVRRSLAAIVDRIDDENASLVHYFDVYLGPASRLTAPDGEGVARTLARALGDAPDA